MFLYKASEKDNLNNNEKKFDLINADLIEENEINNNLKKL